MTMLPLALFLIVIFAVVLAAPLLRDNPFAFRFFVSGHRRRDTLLLRRRIVLENLRDLETERDLQKISDTQFRHMALPLATELEQIDDSLKNDAASADNSQNTASGFVENRLGVYCPACGCLNHRQGDALPEYCIQCGFEFSIASAKNTSGANQSE